MSNPTIDYGYGFVPCEPTDPERTHYLGMGESRWREYTESNKSPLRGRAEDRHRKPVEIPDGWELVPEGEKDTADMKFWGREMNPGWNENYDTVNIPCGIYPFVAAFIRRKPVQPTVDPSKPAVDWSKPIAQIGGSHVRLLGEVDRPGEEMAIACKSTTGREFVYFVDRNGVFRSNPANSIINVPERIKREVWVNVYPWELASLDCGISQFPTRALADEYAIAGKRIACVPLTIDCEKGAGL